jgi:3-methylfumaryl-CoA hydratase
MIDMTQLSEWIGHPSETQDVVTERTLESFRAIFDPHLAPVAHGVAPLGLHWCLAPTIVPMAELGDDGHPGQGPERPPLPRLRRMWAGGWVETRHPLHAGDRVRRVSRVVDVTQKAGRSGQLWFVGVERDYVTERGLAIRERHDIVCREAAGGRARRERAPLSSPQPASRSIRVQTTPTMLFRYSALTFNGHRIHYDAPYATEAEGYEGLVVHAPIQATLLLNLAARTGGAPGRFEYRCIAPAIGGHDLILCASAGDPTEFWAASAEGELTTTARVRDADPATGPKSLATAQ